MARVFVTRRVPEWDEVAKDLVEAGHDVEVWEQNRPMERGELEGVLARGCEALMTLLTDRVDASLLAADHKKRLKIVANYAVGFDNIDLDACKERGVVVTNTPSDKVNESVAEHAWVLMLALTRRLVEAHEFMRNAAYRGWDPGIFLGRDMMGRTLGIVGMGRIGGMVARRARGFGMKVVYYNRERVEEKLERELGVVYGESLEKMVGVCDYVSLHVPLSGETRHMVNGKILANFKKGAYLVNTARGPIVDEVEVVEALRADYIAGYGADVVESEPNPHPELLGMPNVILTPHIASATLAARRDMGLVAVRNIVEVLGGRAAPNEVGVKV